MIKAAFFDIDGTLVSFRTHNIPSSTIAAVRRLKDLGVKVFIATGRPWQFLNSLTEIEPYVDGYITCTGAYSFSGDEVLSSHALPRTQVERLVAECQSTNTTCIVAGKQHVAVIAETPELQYIFAHFLKIDVTAHRAPLAEVLAEDVLQVIPFFTAEQEAAIMPSLPDCAGARWHPACVDVTHRGVDKGVALRSVAERLGIDVADTIAFGDGGNDVAMLRMAGIGVAMGNANDDVKRYADMVTTSVDDDGIANALAKVMGEAFVE